MEQTKILEGNKLIAEFMGYKTNPSGYTVFDTIPTITGQYFMDRLYFHTSWDWLMPVVEKIAKVCDQNEAAKVRMFEQFVHASIWSPITGVWLDCVDFIQWHNEQQNDTRQN